MKSTDAEPPDAETTLPPRTVRSERWRDFQRRCYKPGRRDVGNPVAIYFARPAALLITAAVARWGVTANQATFAAFGAAFLACGAFGCGSPGGWLFGAALLNLWYLIDHVDGQLARLQGQSTLDGAALDYLMHHVVNLLVPTAMGYGLFSIAGDQLWLAAGFGWGVGLLVIGLVNDVRYKSFFQRLKRLEGTLEVAGRNAQRRRPSPDQEAHRAALEAAPDAVERRLVKRASIAIAGAARWASFGGAASRLSHKTASRWVLSAGRAARKLCEVHVLLLSSLVVALTSWLWGDAAMPIAKVYVFASALAGAAVAVGGVARSLRRGLAEEEFAGWFAPPAGTRLIVRDGTWRVEEEPTTPSD